LIYYQLQICHIKSGTYFKSETLVAKLLFDLA